MNGNFRTDSKVFRPKKAYALRPAKAFKDSTGQSLRQCQPAAKSLGPTG